MGVNPNNHRPNHGFPRSMSQVPDNNVSSGAASSSLNARTSPCKMSHGDGNEKERDDGRIRPDEVPDLNLELTVSFRCPSQARAEAEPNPTECNISGGSESAGSPTLDLFR